MPVYVYQSVPQREDEPTERFEIYQSIHAEPLKVHPETGVPLRRVIMGGMFIPKNAGAQRTSTGGGCCGNC